MEGNKLSEDIFCGSMHTHRVLRYYAQQVYGESRKYDERYGEARTCRFCGDVIVSD